MAKSSSGWYMNSLPLKFLFSPFKAIYTVFLIILIIFGASLVSQTYLKSDSLLNQEIKQLNTLGTLSVLTENKNPKDAFNMVVSTTSYKALTTVFFDFTLVNTALKAQKEEDFGYKFKNYLMPRMHVLQHFDSTLKVIAIRLGNISLFIGLAVLLSILGLIDGLVSRAIRQENASRESAGIYHRAKYWRVGIVWLSLMLYLCSPFPVHPLWLLIPVCGSAYMVYLQAKYLKKYL